VNLYVDGVLTPPADAGSLDGVPAALQPVGPAVDGYVVTYDDATGDLELQPGGGGGMTNPMTTIGDLIAALPGGVPTRLAAGSAGYILRVVAGQPTWRELFVAGTSGARPGAAAAREGQWYWSTDAVVGLELAVCAHKGGPTYAWVTVPYGVTSTGVALVQAATAAAARAAIGAGQGLPNLSLGSAYNAGSSATAYLDVAGTPSAAPLGGPGETLVYLFLPTGMPTDARIMAQHMDSGSNTRGWELRYGDNGGDRGLLALLLYGMNFNSPLDLTGATFNGALNVPHVLAIAITAGGVPRYSWDGGAVTALPALAGAYVPPISGDPFTIGSRSGGNYPADKAQIVQFRAYSTVLSDADLVAVAATRTSFVLADPSAGTLTTDLWAPNASGFGSVLDRADTARRWRVNGELKAQEQL